MDKDTLHGMPGSLLTPFAHPLYVFVKPIGARCNLSCRYCYYLEKSRLYPQLSRHELSEEMLELFVKEYIESQTMRQVLFTWHGGEPMLRPLSFYQQAMRLQQKYARGRQIDNVIQTNGTLLTDEWCAFLKENQWLVGVSIDGPQRLHDHYRHTVTGQPTWEKVMRGIGLLKKYGVEWNAMAVVNHFNADYPMEFYHFFKEIDCRYIQLTPVVERVDNGRLASLDDKEMPVSEYSVTPGQWGRFLCEIFDEWVRHDVGQYYVTLFDSTLANWVGVSPGHCAYAKECGHAGVMEFNGDVYSCDHFVFPAYRLGNIKENTLLEMLYGEKQQRFSRLKHASLPRQCLECEWEFACHGECPKNRFLSDEYGQSRLNYLCAGYREYFAHVAPYMDYMRDELAHDRAPANIMKVLSQK